MRYKFIFLFDYLFYFILIHQILKWLTFVIKKVFLISIKLRNLDLKGKCRIENYLSHDLKS